MQVVSGSVFDSALTIIILRGFIYTILFFYVIFALLVVRQVMIMSETILTPVSPIVRGAAIIHAGFAIGFTVFVLGTL